MGTRGGYEDTRAGGELAPGFQRLKAERLTPERLTTVAVTCHLEWMQLGQHAVLTLP